jgi:hypothetical protein
VFQQSKGENRYRHERDKEGNTGEGLGVREFTIYILNCMISISPNILFLIRINRMFPMFRDYCRIIFNISFNNRVLLVNKYFGSFIKLMMTVESQLQANIE